MERTFLREVIDQTGATTRLQLRQPAFQDRMDLISSETAPTLDALGIRFTLGDRDGDFACHVLRAAIDMLGDTAARGDAELLRRFTAYRGKFERLAAEMRAAGHMNPWIGPSSVVAWFADLAD